MVHVFHATINKADHQLNRGLKLTRTPLVAFLATLRNKTGNNRPSTTEKNMESILIVQKVAGGFVDPPARMYAGPAEGYSGGVLCNPAASYFLKP